MDRLVNWTSTVSLQFNVTPFAAIPIQGAPGTLQESFGAIITPGLDFALCPSPIHSLVTSLQAAIGDTQVTNNLAQTRELLSLLADSSANRNERTQPSYLDTYQNYYDAYGAVNNPLKGYESSTSQCTEENGSWPIQFYIPGSAPTSTTTDLQVYYVSSAGVATATAPGAGSYDTVTITRYGVPILTATTPPPAAGAPLVGVAPFYPVLMTFTSIEPLQLSPFIWQEVHERQTGLAQLQNVNIIANMQNPDAARVLRWTPSAGRYLSSIAYSTSATGSPFSNASIQSQFLTPPLELMPIPPINSVDYQQVVSYVYPVGTISLTQQVVQSQTLSLPVIPDYLVVGVVPGPGYYAGTGRYPYATCDATFYVPISSVSITWSNMSGLLSSQSQSQLFNMSKANGLKMTWSQWRGWAQTATSRRSIPAKDCTGAGGKAYPILPFRPAGRVATCGGPLVLRPGKDITLEAGQASGMSAGQWTVQFQLTVDVSALSTDQTTALSYANGCSIIVLAVNGGFFCTKAGSSRVVIGPVPAGSVANAPHDRMPEDSMATGDRLIGGTSKHKRARHGLKGHVH